MHLTELNSPFLTAYNAEAITLINSLKQLKTYNGLSLLDWLDPKRQGEELRKTAIGFTEKEQLNRVITLLKAFNPDFDGKLNTSIENNQVVHVTINSDYLTDISPLRALPAIQSLHIHATQVTDLSPLEGMKLAELRCNNTPIADLLPLHGMPIKNLDLTGTKVTAAEVAELQKTMPECKITWDGEK